jgi:hypothetical protein
MVTVPARELDPCRVMLAKLADRRQTRPGRKTKGRPAPAALSPCLDMAADMLLVR